MSGNVDDRWWSLGFWGLRKKRKQMNRKKNEVDLEHNSPHASGVFGRKITGEDDLSHRGQLDERLGNSSK